MKTKTNVKAGGFLQLGLVNVNDVNILNGINILSGNGSNNGNSSGCGCDGSGHTV